MSPISTAEQVRSAAPMSWMATMASVANGATVLIAGGMNDQPADKTVFAFLTARLVDINGNPIKRETGELAPRD